MLSDTSAATPASVADGFLTHIRQLGGSVLEHVAMRVELLSIEVQEEKLRLVRLAMSAALVSALLIVSLVLAAVLVLAIYWDGAHRVTAAIWLVSTFGLSTIACGLYLASQLRRASTLFATSASELRRDAAAFILQPEPQ